MKKIAFLSLVLWAEVASGQVTYPPVTIAFPHVVAGGDPNGPHYVTLLQIVNNNSASTTAHVTLFSDSGSPLAVLFDGQDPQSTIDLKLDGGQSRQVQININGAITVGWRETVNWRVAGYRSVLPGSFSGTSTIPAHV